MPRSLPLVLAAAAAAVLTGCGGSSSPSASGAGDVSPSASAAVSPALRVRAAGAATSAAGSSRFALTSSTAVGGKTVDITGEGAFDPAASRGTFTLRLGPQTVEERFVGGDLYLQIPTMPGRYYKIALADLTGTALAAGTDPTSGVQALQSASDDVTEVGKEPVRDTPTTHYRGTYDARAALGTLQGAAKAQLDAVLKGSDVSSVPFDAWLDDQGRVRRFSQVLQLTTAGQQLQSTSTVEVYDFGTAVDVAAPDPAQVSDGSAFLAQLKGATATS